MILKQNRFSAALLLLLFERYVFTYEKSSLGLIQGRRFLINVLSDFFGKSLELAFFEPEIDLFDGRSNRKQDARK